MHFCQGGAGPARVCCGVMCRSCSVTSRQLYIVDGKVGIQTGHRLDFFLVSEAYVARVDEL